MNIEINIDDYLSEDEKKYAVTTAFKELVKSNFKRETDLTRILSNTAYEIVHKTVDDILGESTKSIIAKEVKRIVQDKSTLKHSIFKKPDAWDREPNNAYKFLQKCIEEQFSVIKQIVQENIEKETLSLLKENLNDYIVEAVQDLFIVNK
ncbi:hypothetical protein GW796_09205 [archaeon]|nr:hypothetical protein [archaeon]NCT58906.1 hypothetical protein [archaeon]PJB16990.1 MAG: hypothetical protein CO117_13260 [Flavobacteriaceae bacterium CG_4_9_14_3_um_filter_33_16]